MQNINLANARDLIIEIQKHLTSFPAISPSSGGEGEYKKSQWLESKLRSLNFPEPQHIDCPDSRVPSGIRPNLAYKFIGESERTLWLIAHMDVVPAGELSLWETDPFTLTIDSENPDLIAGRGVEDNQQAVTCAVVLGKHLLEHKITPKLSLGLLFVADEETSSSCGIDYVLKNAPDLIKQNDLVLIQDFGVSNSSKIEISEKGVLWLKATVTGKQCHASTPSKGNNSLLGAAELILRVEELNKIFNKNDDLFDPPACTFVPSRHEENVENINTLPGKEVFYIDCRVLADYSFQEVIGALDKIAQEVAVKRGLKIEIAIAHKEEAVQGTDPNSELVIKLKKAIKKVYNVEANPMGAGGATVASFLRHKKIDAVVWGTFIPNFHVPNEKASIKNHIGDSNVVLEIITS